MDIYTYAPTSTSMHLCMCSSQITSQSSCCRPASVRLLFGSMLQSGCRRLVFLFSERFISFFPLLFFWFFHVDHIPSCLLLSFILSALCLPVCLSALVVVLCQRSVVGAPSSTRFVSSVLLDLPGYEASLACHGRTRQVDHGC